MDDDKLRKLWLHFLWSFALSGHMGDASEAVRGFAEKTGLPVPGPDAELEGPGEDESDDADAYWISWIKTQGVESGIHSDEAKADVQ